MPGCCFRCSQNYVKLQKSSIWKIKTLCKGRHKILDYLQRNMKTVLPYPRLNMSFFYLKICSDNSFAGKTDLPFQLGFVKMFSDKGNCHLVFWSSRKSKKATRSVLGSKVMSVADAFDRGFVIEKDLEMMLQKKFRLKCLRIVYCYLT